jgi:pimeloyl-[acyl-carrier protein] methyl ester esterase
VALGESFSRPIAVNLAARRPERVAAVVLAASFVAPPRPSRLAIFTPLIHLHWTPSAVARFFLASASTPPPVLNKLDEVLASLPDAMFQRRVRELLTCDAREALRQTTCPLLLLQAAQDRLLSAQATNNIRNIRPDAQCVTVDAPHLLLQTEPEACARVIEAFLRGD